MRSLALLAASLAIASPASGAPSATSRLGQPVKAGPVRIVPLKIVEDSRCPQFVTCVWRGRLRIQARVQGAMVTLDDGQAASVRGGHLTLVGATPLSARGEKVPPGAYRFTFRFQR
jgi:hypothetical protein